MPSKQRCVISLPDELSLSICDQMSEVPKFMHDYWYARSKDLLVNIPSEHYHSILDGSMNPSSEVHDYIKAAVDWDPQWGFNLFHVLHVEQNNIQVSCTEILCLVFSVQLRSPDLRTSL